MQVGERDADDVMPLLMLADIADASYDYLEPRSSLVKGTVTRGMQHAGDSVSTGSRGGVGGATESPSGSHWYFCELNRMLHSVVSRGKRASSFRRTAENRAQREGWVVLGALEFLTGEFRAVLAQV